MPQIKKLTPNLIVDCVERSLEFYVGVLGFERGLSVPDQAPFVFASVTSGPVEIFFNDKAEAAKEHPELAAAPFRLSGTLFIEVEGIEELYGRLETHARIVSRLVTQWYGMKEFNIADPDGYVITFAERAQQ